MKIINRAELLERRRNLRVKSTLAEIKLWRYIRSRRFENVKFKRQVSIGFYIVDFYNAQFKMAIELDGGHPYTKDVIEYDRKRTKYINSVGIRVIRFSNSEVMMTIEGELSYLKSEINKTKGKTSSSVTS